METGIILLGHGSQAESANHTLYKLIELLTAQSQYKSVEAAFLQFNRPTLPESISKLAAQGKKKILVVPFFLFKGNHVTIDIPEAIALEAVKYPDIEISTTDSIGDDPRLVNIVIDKIKEVE